MGRVGRVIPRFSTALNNARVRNTLGYAASAATVIGAIDQDPANALLAHLGEGDRLDGGGHAQ